VDKHEDERQRLARGPQIQFPNQIRMAVQRALNIPVFALIRHPVQGGGWHFEFRRIA